MIVSHDSGFLDNVCTDIMHYENKKIAYYPGNLSKFVEKVPEARSYYTLAATSVKSVPCQLRTYTGGHLADHDHFFHVSGSPSLRQDRSWVCGRRPEPS